MKKQKKKQRQRAKVTPIATPEMDRRGFLQKIGLGVAGLAIVGVGGYFGLGAVRAGVAERDLTRVGNGKPTIVQVHDPGCPTCNALQKEVREALNGFDNDDLQYLIADIKTDDGASFAAGFGAPHVTLIFLDGQGRMTNILIGLRQSEELEQVFAAHLDAG